MQISANGIAIEVEDLGKPTGEPLLLIMGLGMQLTAWHQGLVQQMLDQGFRVIRFDNRDVGLSQNFDGLGAPNLALAALQRLARWPVRSAYSLSDMADDAAGVLTALGLKSAHVCGASMGGIIAAGLAMEWDVPELTERMREVFVTRNPLDDFTFPLIALVRGKKASALLQKHFGEADLQLSDLPSLCHLPLLRHLQFFAYLQIQLHTLHYEDLCAPQYAACNMEHAS